MRRRKFIEKIFILDLIVDKLLLQGVPYDKSYLIGLSIDHLDIPRNAAPIIPASFPSFAITTSVFLGEFFV